jgi:hypothetical protein
MSTKGYADFIAEQQAKLRGRGLIAEAAKGNFTFHIPKPEEDDGKPGMYNWDPGNSNMKEHNKLTAKIGKMAAKYGVKHTHKDSTFDDDPSTEHTIHVTADHPHRAKIKKWLSDHEFLHSTDDD